MYSSSLGSTLTTLFGELVDGAAAYDAYMLNSEDVGLLASLDHVSAAEASAPVAGGSSIAAHANHLRYSLSLMNRWQAGTSPYADADFADSWRRTVVTDEEWQRLRTGLGDEAHHWLQKLAAPREVTGPELDGIVSGVVHLAYHMGVLRQMEGSVRGRTATDG